jgi:hypothetical protein
MHKHGKVNQIIREEVPEARIYRRLDIIISAFDCLKEQLTSQIPNLTLGLNERILKITVKSYFYDVERLKHFHEIELVNESKKAGYLLKWLVRNKPIYFELDKENNEPHLSSLLLCINEIFALRIAFAYAEIPINKIDDKCWENLIYHMLYREVDSDFFAIFIEAYTEVIHHRDKG